MMKKLVCGATTIAEKVLEALNQKREFSPVPTTEFAVCDGEDQVCMANGVMLTPPLKGLMSLILESEMMVTSTELFLMNEVFQHLCRLQYGIELTYSHWHVDQDWKLTVTRPVTMNEKLSNEWNRQHASFM